jgi:hypothetical protein
MRLALDLLFAFFSGVCLAASISSGSILGIICWGGACLLQAYAAWRDSRPIEIPSWVLHEFLRNQNKAK